MQTILHVSQRGTLEISEHTDRLCSLSELVVLKILNKHRCSFTDFGNSEEEEVPND